MYKQVIVVRMDLRMGKGKLSAQCAHASLGAYKLADKKLREKWESEGGKKVVLGVRDLRELLHIRNSVEKAGIPNFLVRDAGRTNIPAGSITALGIGPEKEEKIDKITSKLKML